MTDKPKRFFQNPNTGTAMVITLGETGRVCLFAEESDAKDLDKQDAADLERWESLAGACGRGTKAFDAMCSQLRHEGAELS